MATDNVIRFRKSGGPGLPPQAPPESMGPRLAAFFLHGVSGRLERLQCAKDVLHQNLKAKEDGERGVAPITLYSLGSLAALCSAEAANIYQDTLCPVIRGLEANCEPDAAPEDGNPAA